MSDLNRTAPCPPVDGAPPSTGRAGRRPATCRSAGAPPGRDASRVAPRLADAALEQLGGGSLVVGDVAEEILEIGRRAPPGRFVERDLVQHS